MGGYVFQPARLRVWVEAFEQRILLSGGLPLNGIVTLNGSPLNLQATELSQGSAIASGAFTNAGDFYYANGKKLPLLRATDSIVVGLNKVSHPVATLDSLTEAGQPLAGMQLSDQLAARTFETSGAAGASIVSDAAMGSLVGQGEIAWTAPVLLDPQTGNQLMATNQVVVGVQSGAKASAIFAGYSYHHLLGTPDQYIVTIPGGGAASLTQANAWTGSPGVAFASPDFYQHFQTDATPNDPLESDQWHLNNTGQTGATAGADAKLPAAWDTTTGSNSVVIAILDNGVQLNQPDLAANIFTNTDEIAGNGIDDDGNGYVDDVNGWNFVDNNNNPNPESANDNHGTAVAGVAAAAGNNGIGVSGASQHAEILPVKIATDPGDGGGFVDDATIAEAVYYAAGRTADGLGHWRGADIINDSWGGGDPDTVLTDAFNWATTNGRNGLGTSVFNAAGNSASGYEGISTPSIPAFAGTWSWVLSYKKDASTSAGDDTIWLGAFVNSDGAITRFDTPNAPTGWSMEPFIGLPGWDVVDDPAHAYGTGRYEAKASTIGDNGEAYILAPAFTITGASIPPTLTIAWQSTEPNDNLQYYLYNYNQGLLYTVGDFGGQDPSTNPDLQFPASDPSTVSVGASTDFDYRSDYSEYGPGLDIVAPSNGGFGGITTTDRTGTDGYNTEGTSAGDYADLDYTNTFGGTSSATPLMSGIAALLYSKNPNLTFAQLRANLDNTADQIGAVPYVNGINTYYGHGRVDAAAALAATVADLTGPTVSGVNLTTDTGISSSDRITSDTNLTLTINFSERTVWSVSDILVTAPDNSVVTPISAHGTGTTTLTLVLPTLAQNGTYTVKLTGTNAFKDQAGNALNNGANQTITFTLDTIAPSVVAAATFNFETQQQLSYLLSEDVSASLDKSHLSLTNLTSGVTINDALVSLAFVSAPAGQSLADFTFAGLPGALLPDGNYTATLTPAGVSDVAGNALTTVPTASFFVLAGDATRDRHVDTNDFVALATHFNQSSATLSNGDFNYDGKVNALDFNILATQFGTYLAPAVSTPVDPPVATPLGAAVSAPAMPNLFSVVPVEKNTDQFDLL